MSQKDNGGLAFPVSVSNNGPQAVIGFHGEEVKPNTTSSYAGMSLRDYFAASAIAGLLARPHNPASDEYMLSRDAYTVADAMLAERAK